MSLVHDLAARALHALDPEDAHRAAITGLKLGLGPRARADRFANLRTTLAGLDLPNPIGLAAGFDKNAEAPAALLASGFGFVEAGTVTPLPQAGNPRPRLFRLTEDEAVINRMGFNNDGLDAFVARRAARKGKGVVGANVGANKDSADRVGDYVKGLHAVWPHCAYIAANVSSPNTPGLRGLQARGALEELLGRLDVARAALAARHGRRPLFLKVAPDLDDAAIADIADLAVAHKLDALIVSNTTIARPASLQSIWKDEAGGLSGAPLFAPSTQVLRAFADALGGAVPLIGAGGIRSGADALAKIRAGACAVQLYSAMVFEGPGLVARIARDLSARLTAEGFARVADAVGAR
jgi:dihydroorotate dehydrogenase